MVVKQVSVFLENREGHLTEVLNALAQNDINIIVSSLADTTDYGMLRMVVVDPEKAKDVIKAAGFSAVITEVICISAPHEAGSLAEAIGALSHADINVEYMYAFSSGEHAAAVLKTANNVKAMKVLADGGFKFWDEEEIKNIGV